jgi:hypothetical protein
VSIALVSFSVYVWFLPGSAVDMKNEPELLKKRKTFGWLTQLDADDV